MKQSISAIGLPQSAPGREVPPWVGRFYRAYVSRDAAMLNAILHDDVDWLLAGPADQIDFFGPRRGKEAVIEVVTRIIPCYLQPTDFEIEHLLVQGERVALYGRLRARQRETGRSICYRGAHFLRFRDGKLISYRGIIDTFDVAEQMVGHPIDVTKRIEQVALAPGDDELLTL